MYGAKALNLMPGIEEEEVPKSSDAASTVHNFLKVNGSSAEKALQKYIVSFETTGNPAIGSAPPCRLYRSLITLGELETLYAGLGDCRTASQIKATADSIMPFRAAYVDLLGMTKAAVTRLKEASKASEQRRKEKADGAEASVVRASKRGRPAKKDDKTNAKRPKLVDNPAVTCTSIQSITANFLYKKTVISALPLTVSYFCPWVKKKSRIT